MRFGELMAAAKRRAKRAAGTRRRPARPAPMLDPVPSQGYEAEDDAATITRRLASAAQEISHWRDFDYVIVNDDLDSAFATLRILNRDRKRAPNLRAADRILQGDVIGQRRFIHTLLGRCVVPLLTPQVFHHRQTLFATDPV